MCVCVCVCVVIRPGVYIASANTTLGYLSVGQSIGVCRMAQKVKVAPNNSACCYFACMAPVQSCMSHDLWDFYVYADFLCESITAAVKCMCMAT